MAGENDTRRARTDAILRTWRWSEERLTAPQQLHWHDDYEHAITHALEHLQRFTVPEALLLHCLQDRWYRPPLSRRSPPTGTVEAWVEAACRSVPAGRHLVPEIVEDAACWRRLQQLVAKRG